MKQFDFWLCSCQYRRTKSRYANRCFATIWCRKAISGENDRNKKDRPQLEELLKVLRKGDKIVIYKLDRISRSTKHLIELSEKFKELGVDFISILDNIDTSNAMGKFFFRRMASIAELERDIISERTKTGLNAARARGKKGGRPQKHTDKVEMALKMYQSKEYSIKQITEATSLSKTTLYRYINK